MDADLKETTEGAGEMEKEGNRWSSQRGSSSLLGPDCQEPVLEVLSLHTLPHVLSGAFKIASK